ncbi:hypothetical protein ACFL96_00400 [Thermoproteota archaeon]
MKILIITHYFPPLNKVGSLRLYSFAKYFSKLGHEVTVLTTKKMGFDGHLDLDLDKGRYEVKEVEYLPGFLKRRKKHAKKKKAVSMATGAQQKEAVNTKIETKQLEKGRSGILKYVKSVVRWMRRYIIGSLADIHDLWGMYAYSWAQGYVNQGYNVVISSFSPPVCHRIASKLKRRNPHITWVADYRDLWSLSHIEKPWFIFHAYQTHLEKRMLSYVDFCVTVSEALQQEMEQAFSKPCYVIENGFFPEEIASSLKGSETETEMEARRELGIGKAVQPFIISYTGILYEGKRDPKPLFQVVSGMIKQGQLSQRDIQIRFYGDNSYSLKAVVNDYGLNKCVQLYNQVSRQEVLRVQQESDALLFLEWGHESAKGVVTGKLFEYLVSGTPILGIGISETHASGQIIIKTQTGFVCGNDTERISRALIELMRRQVFLPSTHEIMQYGRDKIAEKFLTYIYRFQQGLSTVT